MKTRSPKTPAGKYTAADYEAAKNEPVVLASQAADRWRAPHFVWQVRDELGELLCGEPQCEKIDTGGYQVITTLDYRMQRIVEKWVYAAAIVPNVAQPRRGAQDPRHPAQPVGVDQGPPRPQHPQRRGRASWTTGPARCSPTLGSASLHGQGQREVPAPVRRPVATAGASPGRRSSRSCYLIGIDDKTMTASTMFMDVVTNFAPGGAKPFLPTQADGLERGPVRLRSALQFSLNIPAIKAGIINGLDHQFERTKDFGLAYPGTEVPVVSQSIGTLVTHPIDMIERVRRDRQRRHAGCRATRS